MLTIEEALVIPQKIQDEKAGKPLKRLWLADALGLKPASEDFKELLRSSFRYGFTEGTEKADEISLTPRGADATQVAEPNRRRIAIREAALAPTPFQKFYTAYKDAKIPSQSIMKKLLVSDYGIPEKHADRCVEIISANGRLSQIIRDISGTPRVILDEVEDGEIPGTPQHPMIEANAGGPESEMALGPPAFPAIATTTVTPPRETSPESAARAIFVGHGKKHGPLQKLEKFLTSFQIPYKGVVDEANLGRPIPQKVKDTLRRPCRHPQGERHHVPHKLFKHRLHRV